MASAKLNVLGICGSLRKGSYNRMTLNAAIEVAPEEIAIETFDRIGEFPLYNQDLEAQGFPQVVLDLGARIRAADALLFVTPEYNYSMPGVLKNAFDWASRLPDQPFNDKPCAIMGASTGAIGTARAQYHLRQSCVFVNLRPLNRPEVMIGHARERFDENGRLTDEATRKFIAKQLVALADWTRQLQAK
jgi:chromate reductase